MPNYNFFVYIITNPGKTVFYTGVTNDLAVRLKQHYNNRGKKATFAGRYYCYKLIYFEHFSYILDAIEREKEIKKFTRLQKEELVKAVNPKLNFLVVKE